jgi:hypothetical protein
MSGADDQPGKSRGLAQARRGCGGRRCRSVPAAVIPEELPRWCKGPNGPVEGLKRRRAAEVAHAALQAQSLHMTSTGASQTQSEQTAAAPIQLLDAVRHHRNLPHQRQAWQLLQRSLTAEQLNAFATAFRASSKAATPTRPPAAAEASTGLLQLPVPYLSQNDSATSQGSRMCFASSYAVAAAYLKPGCLDGAAQHDDHYLNIVQRYVDTTDASAKGAAFRSLRLQARFRTDGCIDHLIEQLQRGMPCSVGWLHKGPVSAPTGGGHWSLVIGWDAATHQFVMHDPNGEADLVNGGYITTAIGSGWWIELRQDTGAASGT